MHIIFEGVLMPFTQNYQTRSMLVEITVCQSRSVDFFDTHCSNSILCNYLAPFIAGGVLFLVAFVRVFVCR